MLKTEIITDNQRFAAVKSDWRGLLSRSQSTVFQSWSWCWHWWQLNQRGKKLAIIAVFDGDRLVGLLPLFISRFYLGLPIKVAAMLGTGTIDYGGALIDSDADGPAVISLINKLLLEQEWDAVDIHQLPASNPLLKNSAFFKEKVRVYQIDQESTLVVDLPESVEDFRSRLGKKFRTNIDYNWRRLQKDHCVEVKFSTGESISDDMGAFFDMHQKRWSRKRLPGVFYFRKNRDFHRSVAPVLAEDGGLQLSFLLVDGVKVASVYGFKLRDIFYYYLGGFDPEWGNRSVSSLLLYALMTDAIKNGCRVFDFLRGEENYKLRWLAKVEPNYRLLAVRSSIKSGLIKSLLIKENNIILKAKAWLHG